MPPLSADEILLRSLRKRDVALSTSKVKANSLRPSPRGDGKVSLVRQIIGDDRAKHCAKEHIHGNSFYAFGRATVANLSEHSDAIEDHPDPFVGHVNMTLGYPTPSEEEASGSPLMTEARAVAQERLTLLADQFEVFVDPDPAGDAWTGPQLSM